MSPGRLDRRPGRALLVAEAPSRLARPGHRALDGPAGDRLASYAGLTRAELLDRFDTVNLLGRWPGGAGKGAAWPLPLARRAAARLPLRGVVVLLGSRVAAAYGLRWLEWGEWRELPRADVVLLPHPSGVCRSYNDPALRALAGLTLLEAEALARSRVGLPPLPCGHPAEVAA